MVGPEAIWRIQAPHLKTPQIHFLKNHCGMIKTSVTGLEEGVSLCPLHCTIPLPLAAKLLVEGGSINSWLKVLRRSENFFGTKELFDLPLRVPSRVLSMPQLSPLVHTLMVLCAYTV